MTHTDSRPPTDRLFDLAPGDMVEAGPVYRCLSSHPSGHREFCLGLIGAPAIGAVFVTLMEPDEHLLESAPDLWPLVCRKCGRTYVFRQKKVAAAA